jgi:hypothetical protein
VSASHRGPWADTPRAAIDAAVEETKFPVDRYVECSLSDEGVVFLPIDDEEEWKMYAEVQYSESRDQYKAVLARVPHVA